MNYLMETITPYDGLESFKLGASLENVRSELKLHKVPFNQTVDSNKSCTVPVPWTHIRIDNSILLTFATDILFRIYVEGDFKGTLPNGGCIGMDFAQLQSIDTSIQYNDDEEDYYSQEGYWIDDDVETKRVSGITVFIPELEDDDAFWTYEWTKKYM